ncbi:MAG: restriction endonuclease subunit S [Loktanella sp.]|nr:restriction endonuclease subunit S [Loktanella sp.]
MIPSIALGDAFEYIRNGMSVKQSNDGGGIPITRIETISDGTIDLNRVGYAGLQEEDAAKWFLQPGDILLSHINSVEHIGKCALFEDSAVKLVHGMNLLAMRPKRDLLFPRYAMWAMKDPSFKARILKFVNKAVNQASISTTNLKTVEIPLPSLAEQERIAGILDQADALRRLRARALDKLNSLGQAIFHEMFGDGRAPQIEIRDLGRVQTGSTPSTKVPEYFEGDIPFVTPGDLEVDAPVVRYVSEKGAKNSRIVQRGATLVCCIGTLGKMGMSDQRSAFNQQINAVQWSDKVLPEYGLYAMRGIRKEIIHIGKGAATTLPILKKSLFEKMKIRVAPLYEQKIFIDRVQEIEANKTVFTDALAGQSSLFASLQHRAFRGEL